MSERQNVRSGGVGRPMLLPGLRRLWRDWRTVQLGTDPRRAVLLEFTDPALARVLDLLDGSRTERTIRHDAATFGVAEPDTIALLDALRTAGLMLDARTLLPTGLAEPVRRRLMGEAAALALRGAPRPATAIRRRSDARVLITGYGRLVVPIAAALAEAGVGHVDPAVTGRTRSADAALGGLLPADADRPRATAAAEAVSRIAPTTNLRPLRDGTATFVVQAGTYRPASLAALAYDKCQVPHLALDVRDGVAVVGPLVPPSGSPCLNCLDLYRRERDPVWPAVAAQLSTGPEPAHPVAVTTLLAATGYAVDEVLTYLDGGSPQTLGTTIEITGPGRERRRTWPSHHRCECARHRRRREFSAG